MVTFEALDAGAIVLVDLGGERKSVALVVSARTHNRRGARVLIAPAVPIVGKLPWRIEFDDERAFAVDGVAGVEPERITEVVDQAPAEVVRRAVAALMRMV